jgi:formate-dependent nitrite reductase membrane component NrfD
VFWLGALLGGTAVPLILATWVARGGPTGVLIPGSILALVGLAVYEELYIRAGQSVPLS